MEAQAIRASPMEGLVRWGDYNPLNPAPRILQRPKAQHESIAAQDEVQGDCTPLSPAPRLLKRPQAQVVNSTLHDEGVTDTPANVVSLFLACMLSTESCYAVACDGTASFVMLVTSIAAAYTLCTLVFSCIAASNSGQCCFSWVLSF